MTRAGETGTMFHRRLGLLWTVMVLVTLVLSAQMARLSIVEGGERRDAAERRHYVVEYLPTTRGNIVDRHGRTLAVDRPSWDVAVDYEVITGTWAIDKATRAARRANATRWVEMDQAARAESIDAQLAPFTARQDAVWDAIVEQGGLDRAELKRRLDEIKHHVETMAAAVWERQLQAEVESGVDAETFRPQPIREQELAHVILPRVSDRVAFAFRRLAATLPGVTVRDAQRRTYPWSSVDVVLDCSTLPRPLRRDGTVTVRVNGVADHLLGSVRDDVWAADIERRPFNPQDRGGYRVGDDVGHRGLERVFEDHLRGYRGIKRHRLDSGRVQREPHEPGQDLHLTLDVELQARVQALMSPDFGLAVVNQYQAGWDTDGSPRPPALPLGTPLDGAAVVLDVDSGEILALVSTPTRADAAARPAPCRDDGAPWYNRPVEAIYPPGSIAKPLVLVAAVADGVHDLSATIECKGHFLPNDSTIARCWCYRPPLYLSHGPLAAEDAVARSCNIFFYDLAERLGIERLGEWYGRFGVGAPLEIGLAYEADGPNGPRLVGEAGGTLPSAQLLAELQKAGGLKFASIIMGTGQGPITWTPLHAATAYATLARNGIGLQPMLVRDPYDRRRSPPESISLGDDLITTILAGLHASVAERYGTGNHITYPDGVQDPIINAGGVTVWAKTGTAQAPPREFDLDCDGVKDVELDDASHAWFVGLVGPGTGESARPRYAIAVLIEYGGSGGRTAGPIANEIIRGMQAAGYLPEGES